jgi:tight adherence protein B
MTMVRFGPARRFRSCVDWWVSEVRVLALLAITLCVLVALPAHPATRLRTVHRINLGRRRANRVRPAIDPVAAMSAFSAEVRAGSAPATALRFALQPFPQLCPRTQEALLAQGDVAAALRSDAASSRQREWAALAAVWDLTDRRGVSVVAVADRLAEHGRALAGARRLLNAELAEARATVRVLALLPVIGLMLGTVLGANPLRWLMTSSAGHVVIAAAIGFEVLGWLWVRALVRSVARQL